jgi:gephyrin
MVQSKLQLNFLVTGRPRKSLYPIISLEEALDLVVTHLAPLPPVLSKVGSSLRGTVIAESVYGDKDIPMLPSSNVDGYALQGI